MPALAKATLQEISADESAEPIGDPIEVQFNPTSLRMQMSNRTEGGQQQGRTARQYVGSSSTTLALELVFDSADEGTTDAPLSILVRTSQVEYFIKPQPREGENDAPPKVRFHWGQIFIDGVMETLNLDLDHFAHDGTPLRAKATMAIKAQEPEYQFNERGPGANEGGGESAPNSQAAAPGSSNNALSNDLNGKLNNPVTNTLNNLNKALNNKVLKAFDNESLAQLAQRAGIDPRAWRALADGISNPLRLEAGVDIKVGGKIKASFGIGIKAGVQVGVSLDTSTKLGLSPATAGARNDATSALGKGYALATAGGVGSALESLKKANSASAAQSAKLAFAGSSGAITTTETTAVGSEVFELRADPRDTGFGFGIPLRERVNTGDQDRANLLLGQAPIKSRISHDLLPLIYDPTVPAWEALPKSAEAQAVRNEHHSQPCHCGCFKHKR